MSSLLRFDFKVNKETNTINIHKAFNAGINLVWDAWTVPDILDKWWAPKPFITKTKMMDFKEGGHWLYCMIGPAEEVYWSRSDFDKIEIKKSFEGWDAFCNEEGQINNSMPRSYWHNIFESSDDANTLVHIAISYKTLKDLETILEMGFKEGFSMALDNLDQYIEMQTKIDIKK